MREMSSSSVSNALRGSDILDGALPFVPTLSSLFGSSTLEPFAAHGQGSLGEEKIREEDTEVRMTFVRTETP